MKTNSRGCLVPEAGEKLYRIEAHCPDYGGYDSYMIFVKSSKENAIRKCYLAMGDNDNYDRAYLYVNEGDDAQFEWEYVISCSL